jgi:beta-glucosidase
MKTHLVRHFFRIILSSSLLILPLHAAELTNVTNPNNPASLARLSAGEPEIWRDASQPMDVRIHDLVCRMSLKEKVSQLNCDAPAIPRLGIPAYSYRNECLHGVATHEAYTTDFPQAIGMAATWDTPLIHAEADAIATEARATHNSYIAKHHGNSAIHIGLNFYTPNINIFRDPRWGRGQETYGEDPFLTAQMAVAFIQGLQGNNPKYFKAIACAKHFAVHSGPEPERHFFDAKPSERDLYETYLPAFEAAVREGHVDSVMGAYSALYGVPDCANHFLLTDLLRKQWGFDGFVVSDGGAIADINNHHKYVPTAEEAAAVAVKAGCDMCSGGGTEYDALIPATQAGLISETQIDAAISRSLEARFRLGMFDPPSLVPWSKIGMDQNNTPEHAALALKVAQESIVLLKNNGLLPLDQVKIKRIAVIGTNANSARMLLGNYQGKPSRTITILDGIKALAGTNIQVVYETGCPLALMKNEKDPGANNWQKAITAATAADVVIYVGGISPQLEGEEMKVNYYGFNGGDRTRIELPDVQTEFLKALQATGKPVVFVNCSGSAMAMPWVVKHLPAIVQAWYPGEEGGRAVAEVLFGEVNPAGRLPITFYRSTKDLPPFDDYSMSNRTYRYFGGTPEFAFGHGLSYTKFDYHGGELNQKNFTPQDTVKVSFTVKNSGARDGDEVAQLYFRHIHSAVPQPKLALCGFTRIHLSRGQATRTTIVVPAEYFRYWDTKQKQYVVDPGNYELLVGAASDDIRLKLPFTIAAAR